MRLRCRVKRRAIDSDDGGCLTAQVILVPLYPEDKNDVNAVAWRNRRPVGMIELSFLDPHIVERMEPGSEIEVKINPKREEPEPQ
jgi:hypothetical protein